MPQRQVTRYDIEIRPVFETVPKGHRLRLLIGTNDTPHLLPPPMKLLALLGGVHQLQHHTGAVSHVDLRSWTERLSSAGCRAVGG